jgi:hypothetical protein
MHRCRNEPATARHFHVGIGIRYNRGAAGIDNLAVNTRVMIDFFLDHLERAGLGQVSVAPARDG